VRGTLNRTQGRRRGTSPGMPGSRPSRRQTVQDAGRAVARESPYLQLHTSLRYFALRAISLGAGLPQTMSGDGRGSHSTHREGLIRIPLIGGRCRLARIGQITAIGVRRSRHDEAARVTKGDLATRSPRRSHRRGLEKGTAATRAVPL